MTLFGDEIHGAAFLNVKARPLQVRSRDYAMKAVTVDMLRAHLMAASLTAMGAEGIAFLASMMAPISQQTLSSQPVRILSIAIVVSGVIVVRRVAGVAFDLAIARHQVTPSMSDSRHMLVPTACPRRWLVILHLRLRGRPFVLAEE